MELQNREFLKNIPSSPDNYLLTKSLSKDGSFFILSYVPLNQGLLRSHFHRKGEKSFLSFDEHARQRSVPENEQLTDVVYASKSGLKMAEELEYSFFINNIYEPSKWGGVKVGQGSESLSFRANLAGRDVLVKLANKEGIERTNNFWEGRQHLYMPDYSKKFGITEKISKILQQLQKIGFFVNFELMPSPKEHLASRRFLIEDFIEGTSVDKLHDKTECYVAQARFYQLSTITLAEVLPWVTRFKEDLQRLEDVFFVAEKSVSESGVLGKIDFALGNWMIVGMNNKNQKPRLVLIDQAPALMASGRPDYDGETPARLAELKPKVEVLPAYKVLLKSDFVIPR